jgi:hypothetical protein
MADPQPEAVDRVSDVSFPMECPQCRAVSGMPYRATTMIKNGAICVELRCCHCHHEWEYEMPVTDDLILKPKQDRRK